MMVTIVETGDENVYLNTTKWNTSVTKFIFEKLKEIVF